MENTKYGRRREGRWTPIRAKAQDTRANPSSWETHLVRKRWDIGLLRASSSLIMMMMMMLDLKHCPARRKSDHLPPGRGDPGQSRNRKKCPASQSGLFRDNETSRNEVFWSSIRRFCCKIFQKSESKNISATKQICKIANASKI